MNTVYSRIIRWIREHPFQAHTAAFSLMLLPCIPLYFAAGQNANLAIALLVGLIVAGNLLAFLAG